MDRVAEGHGEGEGAGARKLKLLLHCKVYWSQNNRVVHVLLYTITIDVYSRYIFNIIYMFVCVCVCVCVCIIG